jgi:hypothetical protein
MLKHRAVTQSRAADAETQRKPPRTDDAETQRKPLHSQRSTTTLKHQPSLLHENADTVKSAIPVAETTRDLRC